MNTPFQTSVHLRGSAQLNVALPGLSDVDALVTATRVPGKSGSDALVPSSGQTFQDAFFRLLFSRLSVSDPVDFENFIVNAHLTLP